MNFLIYISVVISLVFINSNAVTSVDYYTEQPTYLPLCKINDPGFTKCSTNSVQKLIDQLIIGIPEILESFGSLDPMHVRDIVFKQDNNEVATIQANLTELIVKGFSKTLIKQNKISKKDFSWDTKIFLPKMRLDGHYQMMGRILLLPLQGAGKMFIEIENLDILLHTTTHLYEKGGFTFDNVTGVRIALNMTRVRTQFDDLFNGNSKDVERSTNEFFNDNWRQLYEALKPVIYDTVEQILFDLMHKIFNLIPANFFIEDIPTSKQFYADKTKNL